MKFFYIFLMFILLPLTFAHELMGNGSETTQGRGIDCPPDYYPKDNYCFPMDKILDKTTLIIALAVIIVIAYYFSK